MAQGDAHLGVSTTVNIVLTREKKSKFLLEFPLSLGMEQRYNPHISDQAYKL